MTRAAKTFATKTFIGKPCVNCGPLSPRYMRNGSCVACARLAQKRSIESAGLVQRRRPESEIRADLAAQLTAIVLRFDQRVAEDMRDMRPRSVA